VALVIHGMVNSVRPTKGGEWAQVIIAGRGRVNDLVMVDRETGETIKPGVTVELPVRAVVDTNAEGRPTRNIVYFLEDAAGAA